MDKVQVATYVHPDTRTALRRIGAEEGQSVSKLLEMAIGKYLEDYEKELKER